MTTQKGWPSLSQKIKGLSSLFTQNPTVPGPSSISPVQNSVKSNPMNLYQHCSECPLEVFIDALVNHNLNRLVRGGRPTEEEIGKAWQNLFFEYCDLSGTKSYRQLFAINKEIGILHSRRLTIQLCIRVLSVHPMESAKQELRRAGYNYKFDHNTWGEYVNDLKNVSERSRSIEIALKEREFEYEQAIKQYGGKEITTHDFEKILVELSKYMGFRLSPREMTVSEYVAIYAKYEKESEMIERINAKQTK